MKTCAVCGILYNPYTGGKPKGVCSRGCNRRQYRLNRYGITQAEFTRILEQQNNVCALCKIPSRTLLHVDHDHATNKVRGLLCVYCNTRLGWLENNEQLIQEYRGRA